MDKKLSASIAIWNKNNVWVDDNMVTNCHHCDSVFGFINRKHHCRNCGNIFCYNCTKQAIVIPKFITDKPDPGDYWNLSHYVKSLKEDKEKVCVDCFLFITEQNKSYEKIIKIFEDPIGIDRIRRLSDDNIHVKNHYFDHLRNTQYYLPNHEYSSADKKILLVNSTFFCKHSKYLVQFIKSIEWDHQRHQRGYNTFVKSIMEILNGKMNSTCEELFCTRTCQETLSCDDCVNILFTHANCLPPDILKYLFENIYQTHSDVILSHLPFFVTLIKNCDDNKLLQIQLYNLVNMSSKLIYRTYWLLTNDFDNSNQKQKDSINGFIDLFDDELVKQMGSEYMFYAGLIKNLNNAREYLLSYFEQYKPITVPYDPDIVLLHVHLDSIITKNSYTKPVIITFDTNVGPKRMLFKNESIMNDITVLNLMTLCDIVLRESIDEQFRAVVYPVMPLTYNSGMIELVDDATTIHDIVGNKKTILQHIIEQNQDKIIGEVIDKYMYSLVSYTLHSYFIGLGDRHLQNIMITHDGSIFHIDFGFILGKDSHPITFGDIKLNTGMLDVIGGQDSTKYEMYLNLCSDGVTMLRKYFNMFYILLCQIESQTFDKVNIEKFIMSRFQPRQTDYAVISELMAVIQHSNDSYGDIIRDFLHYHTQEKTVQNRLGQLIKITLSAVKNITGSGT